MGREGVWGVWDDGPDCGYGGLSGGDGNALGGGGGKCVRRQCRDVQRRLRRGWRRGGRPCCCQCLCRWWEGLGVDWWLPIPTAFYDRIGRLCGGLWTWVWTKEYESLAMRTRRAVMKTRYHGVDNCFWRRGQETFH